MSDNKTTAEAFQLLTDRLGHLWRTILNTFRR